MKRATKAWLVKAAEDLDAIRSLRGNPQLTGVVAFHAQQCVEKCLKAVAEERAGHVPRVHDLRRLWEVVADLRMIEGKLPPRVVSLVLEWAFQHRDELMDNWKRAERQESLAAIEPLV
jgi:HEPN domain-containing protein